MISGKTVLAIIPARAGSRRAPDKNLTLFKINGEYDSLIGWALKHAAASRYIDRTVIVSDCPAALAHAKPPVIALPEPAFLATPHSRMEAVIAFTLYSTTLLGEPSIPFHDLFVLLQPTSPYRTAQDIDACLEIAASRGIGVKSVNPARQLNGAVYVSHTDTFLSSLKLDQGESYPMPADRSLDIDYPEDFHKSS